MRRAVLTAIFDGHRIAITSRSGIAGLRGKSNLCPEEGRLIPPGRRGCGLIPGRLAHMTQQQRVEAAMRELSKTPESPRRIKAVFAAETLTPGEIDELYGQLALTK